MRDLRGKRALVTGAAGGIGRAIALELAGRGTHVCLVDLDEQRLAATAAEVQAVGVDVLALAADLTETDQMNEVIEALLVEWPSLDLLVNNAGVKQYGPAAQISLEQWQHLLATNLYAPIRLTQSLLPLLLERPEAHVLNVASILGLIPMRKVAAYQTTKHALVGYSRALRAEYWSRGLGVTTLCPGFVRTAMLDEHSPPRWLCTTPEHVARRAVSAIQRNRGLVTVTPLAKLLWWFDRVSPTLMDIVACGRLRQHRPAVPAPHLATRQTESERRGKS